METTLHRQLKELYADDPSRQEVVVDGFRIDAVRTGQLVEIQAASLAGIRDKVRRLLESREVLVVKPLAARKYLVTRTRKGGRVRSARYSPSRMTSFHVFDELVHFMDVFPHPRLTVEILLTEQEEHRLPARRLRWFHRGYRVEDRVLRTVYERRSLRGATDLPTLLPDGLPEVFSTVDLAREAEIPRWLAQKMAYCLRKSGAVQTVGKRGNSVLYCVPRGERAAA